MTIENTIDVDTDDLDAFSNTFFGVEKEPEDQPPEEDVEDPTSAIVEDDEADESGDDVDADPDASEDDPEDDNEEDEPAPKPTKGRKSAKERISELTAKAYEAERKAKVLEDRLAELEKLKEEKPSTVVSQPDINGPNPDDTLEDGSLKYPLGEFDPTFIRDLTRYTINKETEAAKAKEAEDREQEKMAEAQQELQDNWTKKIEAAVERLPDFREKAVHLEETFRNLDPSYGEYLASTIMSMEYGPDVLHYLASNIDEAQRIAASGPTAATIALGRLEAKFESPVDRPRQMTKAPEPAPRVKGSSAARVVADDTDDLDAFEEKFFNKKK